MVFAKDLRTPEGPVLLPDGSWLVVEMGPERGCITRIGRDGEAGREEVAPPGGALTRVAPSTRAVATAINSPTSTRLTVRRCPPSRAPTDQIIRDNRFIVSQPPPGKWFLGRASQTLLGVGRAVESAAPSRPLADSQPTR